MGRGLSVGWKELWLLFWCVEGFMVVVTGVGGGYRVGLLWLVFELVRLVRV